MNLADFNIRATPPQRTKRVMEDLELALALGLWVYCWQELGKFRRYIRALKRVFTEDRWLHLFEGKRNIISVRRNRYAVDHRISRRLSKRAPWLPQPKRLANAALLRDLKDDELDWVVNFHLTNGAKNKRWFPKRIKEARLRRWHQEVVGLRDLVAELMNIADVPIWLCADSNSFRMPHLGSNQHDIVSAPPMHISVINFRGDWRHLRFRAIDVNRLNTDHDGLVVE